MQPFCCAGTYHHGMENCSLGQGETESRKILTLVEVVGPAISRQELRCASTMFQRLLEAAIHEGVNFGITSEEKVAEDVFNRILSS